MRLLLVAFGLAFGIIAVEGALQIAPFSVLSYPLYQSDEYVGTVLRPNQQGWQTKEGRTYVRTNRHGYRDFEHDFSKPAKTFRIAVLGDSFAEAVQVEIEETFWSVLGRQLEPCLPDDYDNIEILNFGVSGYGTAQELLMLRHYVWKFDPDLVLLAFLPSNDIRNNSKELEPQKQRPFFVLEDGELRLDNSFREDPEWQNFRNSSWVRFKDWTIRTFELGALLYKVRHYREAQQLQEEQGLMEAGLSSQIFRPPQNEAWSQAWEIAERLILKIHEEVSDRNIPFVVMSVTSGVVVRPETGPRKALRKELGVADLFHPDRWIAEIGEEHGFSVVLLSETMQDYAKKHYVYFHGFENTEMGTGHWNERGHEFAGKRAAEVICEQGLLQPRESDKVHHSPSGRVERQRREGFGPALPGRSRVRPSRKREGIVAW